MATEGLGQINTESFTSNIALNLQQQISKLRGKVLEGSYRGKQASVIDYVKPVAMQTPAGRNALVNVVNTDYQRRWVTPVDKELVQRVDTFDKLRTIEDPTSALVQGTAAAVAREWDDRIIAAAHGTVQISSTDGTTLTTETFAQAATAATGSTTGLTIADTFGNGATTIGFTIAKMIEARRIFRHLHLMDMEMQPGDLTIIMGSQQEADLLQQVEFTSNEFASNYRLEKGTVDGLQFMGFNLHVSERLNVNNNIRDCIVFAKTGLHLGVWLDTENLITRESLISGAPWQIHTMMSSGATRLEPGRVLKLQCGNDTTGADNI